MVATSLCAIAVLTCLARADQSPRTVTIEGRFFPNLRTMNGNWAALKAANDGKVYAGLARHGCHGRLFSYEPSTDAYDVLGFVDVNRRPYYTWQAYVIDAMASGSDGTIYIGEDERISKLYLFYPWQ